MLVKIIAMGLEPKIWETFFATMRNGVSESSFSAMAFTSRQEMTFLATEFFPTLWNREKPDFLLCGTKDNGQSLIHTDFLHALPSQGSDKAEKVLVLDSLEKGIRNLLTNFGQLEVRLENGSAFTFSDSACLVRSFPADFPKVPVHDLAGIVRLKKTKGQEIRLLDLPFGTLLGFDEIEVLLHGADLRRPKDWLKAVAKQHGLKRIPPTVGLIREKNGVFLFPGVPFHRIQGLRVDGIEFSHVVETKRLTADADQFVSFLGAVNDVAEVQEAAFHDHNLRLRRAELLTEIPIICGGSNIPLRETMAALLNRRGHQRCFSLNSLEDGLLKEPALLLKLDAWREYKPTVQVHEPLLMDLAKEVVDGLRPLEGLLAGRKLVFQPPPPSLPEISPESFSQRKKRLADRAKKAAKAMKEEGRRHALLKQEVQVQETAYSKLTELLEAEEAVQVWDGTLPDNIHQALLFSHDKEEAGAVLQALSKVAKKRWFDLSDYTSADRIQSLSLDEVNHYREQGVILITSSSQNRLAALRNEIEEVLPHAKKSLEQCEREKAKQQEQLDSVDQGIIQLAQEWMWHTLDGWLSSHEEQLFHALDSLRDRHERLWLNRSHIHRALVLQSVQENMEPLLDTCVELFPAFNRNLSVVVPYEFDFQDELPEKEIAKIQDQARTEKLSAKALQGRMETALRKRNESLFADFLQVVSGELVGVRVDLIVIEHHPEIATRILTHLRKTLANLTKTPALLVLSDNWAPPQGKPLPWEHTRAALYRRLGPISAQDCAEHLRPLFPQ